MHSKRYINEVSFAPEITPEALDRLLAKGWRHFGGMFFRYNEFTDERRGSLNIQPLRVVLRDYRPTKSQRRVLRKNADTETVISPTEVSPVMRSMFHRHKQRFESNIPESLDDFLGQEPGSVTCSFMFQVFLEKRLVAVSFTDLGEQSISSVYGIFEPELSPRSLGLYTLLQELEFARKRQLLYHYSGYGTVEPSHYDYKKQFHGLQAFDWETEAWAPLPRLLGKD